MLVSGPTGVSVNLSAIFLRSLERGSKHRRRARATWYPSGSGFCNNAGAAGVKRSRPRARQSNASCASSVPLRPSQLGVQIDHDSLNCNDDLPNRRDLMEPALSCGVIVAITCVPRVDPLILLQFKCMTGIRIIRGRGYFRPRWQVRGGDAAAA